MGRVSHRLIVTTNETGKNNTTRLSDSTITPGLAIVMIRRVDVTGCREDWSGRHAAFQVTISASHGFFRYVVECRAPSDRTALREGTAMLERGSLSPQTKKLIHNHLVRTQTKSPIQNPWYSVVTSVNFGSCSQPNGFDVFSELLHWERLSSKANRGTSRGSLTLE